ncbi:hypothetical protein [Enterococcus sp. DIV1420a]
MTKGKGLFPSFSEELDDQLLESFIFSHKTIEGSNYSMMDLVQIH